MINPITSSVIHTSLLGKISLICGRGQSPKGANARVLGKYIWKVSELSCQRRPCPNRVEMEIVASKTWRIQNLAHPNSVSDEIGSRSC